MVMKQREVSLAMRVAELEAELAARNDQLRHANERYHELSHRIRNDLEELLILPTLRAGRYEMPDSCQRCLLRLSSVVELHRLLDDNGTEAISMVNYLPALSAALRAVVADRVVIETAVEREICLIPSRAQCVGMIYAEAIINALKHAFPDGTRGTVKVQLRQAGGMCELDVTDDGIGFDPDKVRSGLGTQLMTAMARQVEGTLQLQRLPKGTSVRLTFPALKE
jgi:two-component sensor histidine kinase